MSSLTVFVIVCAVLGLLSCMPVESRHIKRSAEDESEPPVCSRSTPCGWEVYEPYERRSDYFIKSPCECASGMMCVRTSDDISISAYVHRCRPENEAAALRSESSSED